MGFWGWLFGRSKQQTATQFLAGVKTYNREIVGESNYQDALLQIVGRKQVIRARHECIAVLVPEPDNPHDPNAIAVYINGHKVGYLPRKDASRYCTFLRQSGIHQPLSCNAAIVGGWLDDTSEFEKDRSKGSFGVWLNMRWPPRLADGQ